MVSSVPKAVLDAVRTARRVAVLTGAGMSAESGIPTFRDSQSGLWTKASSEDLATPTAWNADPPRIWAWYAWRAVRALLAEPHAGHRAIAEWGRSDGVTVQVITQNVDNLHERAGSTEVAHLHGSLFAYKCDTCGAAYRGKVDLPREPIERLPPPGCPICGVGQIRPDIVWFGEPLDNTVYGSSVEAVADADVTLVVGTSGLVFPAAGLPRVARNRGVPVIEINPYPSDLTGMVDFSWRVSAAEGLPSLVAALGR